MISIKKATMKMTEATSQKAMLARQLQAMPANLAIFQFHNRVVPVAQEASTTANSPIIALALCLKATKKTSTHMKRRSLITSLKIMSDCLHRQEKPHEVAQLRLGRHHSNTWLLLL
jgi:hypothetical protein